MTLLNFRDVANGPGTRPLAPGRLFRSAQPFHLTDDEAEILVERGVRVVLDLREPDEIVPPDWEPLQRKGIQVHRVRLLGQVMAARAQPLTFHGRNVDGHTLLAEFYVEITEHARHGLGQIVEAVAGGDPVLLHCAAGKDRTGTAVAILLDLIGVDEEAIVADYLLTNNAQHAIVAQLSSGVPAAEAIDPTTLAPGIDDAPESAIRALLHHLRSVGGAAQVVSGATTPAIRERAAAALTGR